MECLGTILLKPIKVVPILMVPAQKVQLKSSGAKNLVYCIKESVTFWLVSPNSEVTNLKNPVNSLSLSRLDHIDKPLSLTVCVTQYHNLHFISFVRRSLPPKGQIVQAFQ